MDTQCPGINLKTALGLYNLHPRVCPVALDWDTDWVSTGWYVCLYIVYIMVMLNYSEAFLVKNSVYGLIITIAEDATYVNLSNFKF